ncbi:hypothetical protein [Caudoviricetes sp.]|nr:hypothetical protein [Caudoviricetes sp.]
MLRARLSESRSSTRDARQALVRNALLASRTTPRGRDYRRGRLRQASA